MDGSALWRTEEFQFLPNKYAPYAEGGPVEDSKMFVGRDTLLERLEHSLLSGSGTKCIVMFGQKGPVNHPYLST